MEAARVPARSFDHLREHSIGLPQVLFQSITHMAPGAAVAYSIYISVPFSKQALALSVLLALIACLCAAVAIGQLARPEPSARRPYAHPARPLGPPAGFIVAWLFILFEPLVAPFLYLEFGWAMREVMGSEAGWHYTGQWWIWATLMTVIVFLLTYRDIRLSTTVGVILGAFEIVIVVSLAICNSIAANSTAAVNAATRVFYALARNRLAPRPLGRTHPRFKTPHVAIIWMSAFALVLSFALGWKWGPLVGFAFIATLAVIVVVIVYILICLGCIWHYWTKRRAEFNWFLHGLVPAAGAILFFFPLYYEYVKFPPTYPIKYANWVALGWVAVGIALTFFLYARYPDRLRDMDRVYVEDETVASVPA